MLCAHHHRTAWEYHEGELARAVSRWSAYQSTLAGDASVPSTLARAVSDDFMARLDDDLDTPGALAVLDDAVMWLQAPGRRIGARVTAAQLLTPLLDIIGAPIAPR
jgi:cysteinyl-tRNA synthetase